MSTDPQVVATALVRVVVDGTGSGPEQALTRGPSGEVHVTEVSTSSEQQQVTYLFKARGVESMSLTNAFSGESTI